MPATSLAVMLCLSACGRDGPEASAEPDPMPEMDIYIVELSGGLEQGSFGEPRNVTRRDGYDNQPVFLPDGSGFLFTSFVDDQADTYRYQIADGSIHRVTASTAGEWAPALTPDGEGFTISRNEPEGFQRLWRFPMDGRSPRVVLRDITGAGYHTWVDENTVALYLLSEPPDLALVDIDTASRRIVASNVGRCVQRVPQTRELAFVDKRDGDNWRITYLDLDSMTVTRTLPTLPGREDFALAADGSILMAQGGRLYRSFPGKQTWELLADWDASLPGHISRIAVSPTGRHLAFVVWEEPGE
ncbi:MAG: hypothetical protein PVI25_04585 [Gammaproteobacteria bacterium]|jgi:hypothetical protein